MDTEERGIAAKILNEIIILKMQPLLQSSVANLIKVDTGSANWGTTHFEENVSGSFLYERQ